ncbi:unnamed protein product [marine sediment metagenome]|uniref:Uncharacterized protein n=1 Tax=marine sediment metagenome TaxID=412755 RepID=X1C4X7_9ZZZZ
MPVTPATTEMDHISRCYDFIDDLGPEDTIVFDVMNGFGWFLTTLPASTAILNHAIEQDVNIIFVSEYEDGPLTWKYLIMPAIKESLAKMNYIYGEDWVEVGYIPGGESADAAFAADLHHWSNDMRGNLLSDLPMMDDLQTAADLSLWIGNGWQEIWIIRQVYEVYGTPIIMTAGSWILGRGPVYVSAGQMVSFINGWDGAAVYEYMRNDPGLATQGSIIISSGYVYIIIIIILANVSYIYTRSRGKTLKRMDKT